MARDLVLTGIPRGGTTLCCGLLGRAADTVALVEPMPVHLLPTHHFAAVAEVAEFFQSARKRLLEEGVAPSQQVAGHSPDNFFDSECDASGARLRKASLGDVAAGKPLSLQFNLAIKHNAAFTALLPSLKTQFECVAIVRNPLSVLASWNSVALPVAQGRLPAGERFDAVLAARLDAQPDVLRRQLILLDWLFTQFVQHLPQPQLVLYEDIIASGGAALGTACGISVPEQPLQSRNASHLYDMRACEHYAQHLLQEAGAWRKFYGNADITQVLDKMRVAL